jgi:hypothetical protein
MPPVKNNPSRLLGTAIRPKDTESSGTSWVARSLMVSETEKLPRIQSFGELWQVMKDVLRETRRVQAEDKARTPQSPQLHI